MNEMRKLMEVVEQINEDPTVGGNMANLQRKLTDVVSYAEELYWNYEKYPDLKEHQSLMQEIQTVGDRLQQLIRDIS